MPELPDVVVYVEALTTRIVGQRVLGARLSGPFVLRTFDPPLTDAIGRKVSGVRRIGKRIVWDLEDDLHLVFHLMIAGRFHWKPAGAKPPGKIALVTFSFPTGTLVFTEASPKKRASLHVVRGAAAVDAFDPGGVDVFAIDTPTFAAVLRRERHTVKRSLTDPTMFDGIGNAYSDEILHRARLSPLRMTDRLTDDEIVALHAATRDVLRTWTERLRAQTGAAFPERVTAFRPEMAVHGRHGEPCPVCSTPVQRIVHADNETNYCPTCQTGGTLLADRSLSRLLKDDWPRSIDELELRRRPTASAAETASSTPRSRRRSRTPSP